MAKLVKFKDGKFSCWSRVDLDNGEPLWISVAHNGVIIKKSKWSILGEKIYKANSYEANQIASALLTIYWDEAIKEEYEMINKMTNPLLSAFTLAAMLSKSTIQLSSRLNNALESGNEQIMNSIEDMKARFDKAFGKF